MKLFALAFALMIVSSTAPATPPPIDRVAFAPREGAMLPLDAAFIDEYGHAAILGDYFGARPAIVVLAYYGCSNLCSVVLNGVANALAATDLHAGRDVEVVVASIAPLETPELALNKKRAVLDAVANADASGWHFLTGSERSIDRLTQALGYRYAYDDTEKQYAHAAGIVIATLEGRITKTLYGVASAPEALRDTLHGAAPLSDATNWLLCFHYDPVTGRYSGVAMTAVRLAAIAAFVALCGYIVLSRVRERRPS